MDLDILDCETPVATSMLVTNVGDKISVGHQQPKDVTNIEILSQ